MKSLRLSSDLTSFYQEEGALAVLTKLAPSLVSLEADPKFLTEEVLEKLDLNVYKQPSSDEDFRTLSGKQLYFFCVVNPAKKILGY